jgi:hypothetical protein
MEQSVLENQVIEIEAESLEAARQEAQARVPAGLSLISERILSDGKGGAEKGIADTEEAAFELARKKIPPGGKIVEERIVTEAAHKTLPIRAFDDEEAMGIVQRSISKAARVENLELKAAGRKGFLGVGKKPHQYEAKFFQPAVASVKYAFPAKICVKFGEPPIMEYFEVDRPSGEPRCSDNDCPCPPPGTLLPACTGGYLVISESCVEFHRDARTLTAVMEKANRMQSQGAFFANRGVGVTTPVLCCGRSPRLHNLDKSVAAADAMHWWKTGLAPLRATPRI